MKRKLLKVTGADAATFLQGQISCDIEKLSEDNWQLGAICNPQGRIVASFDATKKEDHYLLRMPEDILALTITHLTKYAIFSKVKLTESTEAEEGIAINDNWQQTNIDKGIATIYKATTEKFLPHHLNFDKVGAIDFNKGCYTGQEIIARMHYKGKLKQHLYPFELKHKAPLPPGTEIKNQEGKPIGHVIDSYTTKDNTQKALVTLLDEFVGEEFKL